MRDATKQNTLHKYIQARSKRHTENYNTH